MGPNMPVSSVVCESAAVKCNSAIQNSLAASASSSSHNSNQFLTINKLARLGTVEYEESPPDFRNNINETLKSKYIVLQASAASQNNNNNKFCKYIYRIPFPPPNDELDYFGSIFKQALSLRKEEYI